MVKEQRNKERVLREETEAEVQNNILPYWLALRDYDHGGFYGRVDGDNRLHKDADKGAIYMCRILWTFSRAYRLFGKADYLDAAVAAKEFIFNKMIDHEYGGIYWAVSYCGSCIDGKKQSYAQGFAIYALSEYYRATGDRGALDLAVEVFELLERYAHDPVAGGYLEAFTKEWQPISDMRLSKKDDNEPKTMNTHLHILEPYTNLYLVWRDGGLGKKLTELVEIFMDKIVDSSHHCGLFFDMNWRCMSHITSYGHDIEAFWLIHEAIETLGNPMLKEKYSEKIKNIAYASFEGLDADGSMMYEKDISENKIDSERHWWVQAETVVGCFYLYKYYGDVDALDKAVRCWAYIKMKVIDRSHGEWVWSVLENGEVNTKEDKAGFWKCPYHNGRCSFIINSL